MRAIANLIAGDYPGDLKKAGLPVGKTFRALLQKSRSRVSPYPKIVTPQQLRSGFDIGCLKAMCAVGRIVSTNDNGNDHLAFPTASCISSNGLVLSDDGMMKMLLEYGNLSAEFSTPESDSKFLRYPVRLVARDSKSDACLFEPAVPIDRPLEHVTFDVDKKVFPGDIIYKIGKSCPTFHMPRSHYPTYLSAGTVTSVGEDKIRSTNRIITPGDFGAFVCTDTGKGLGIVNTVGTRGKARILMDAILGDGQRPPIKQPVITTSKAIDRFLGRLGLDLGKLAEGEEGHPRNNVMKHSNGVLM